MDSVGGVKKCLISRVPEVYERFTEEVAPFIQASYKLSIMGDLSNLV